MEGFDPASFLEEGRSICEQARSGRIGDDYYEVELTYDIKAWPQPWIAADLITHEIGSAREAQMQMVLAARHSLAVTPEGDVDALLAAGDLEGAWRACLDPALADVIEARDAAVPITKLVEPKKKADLEKVWTEAAVTLSPRSAFAGTWPTKWKDAQRRMRVLYARPRSPLFAAAALELANREDVGYSSISAQTFWQALCWFIAAQGDVRQIDALEALEQRVCKIEQRTELWATPALRAFVPRPLAQKTRDAIAALGVAKPAPKVALSLASAEEREVAADQLLLEGDPRGELIVVQQRISDDGPTKELLKEQKALLRKHIKAWCPAMVVRDSCVFRRGVPVAGQLQFHSDAELRSFVGAKALATFETLLIPWAAMGPIEPSTIADLVRSLPNLRHVITSDTAAVAIAKGAATGIEQLTIEGARLLPAERPGLPKLRRVDGSIAKVDVLGVHRPEDWKKLRKEHPVVVLMDYLHNAIARQYWELWADGDVVTATPVPGSTQKTLTATLERVSTWDGVRVVRVPANFKVDVPVAIEPTAAFEPATLGLGLFMRQ